MYLLQLYKYAAVCAFFCFSVYLLQLYKCAAVCALFWCWCCSWCVCVFALPCVSFGRGPGLASHRYTIYIDILSICLYRYITYISISFGRGPGLASHRYIIYIQTYYLYIYTDILPIYLYLLAEYLA